MLKGVADRAGREVQVLEENEVLRRTIPLAELSRVRLLEVYDRKSF